MSDKTYIVTGMPRSGTSMMMHCLASAGLSALHDLERDKHFNSKFDTETYKANPNGCYETFLFVGRYITTKPDGTPDDLPKYNPQVFEQNRFIRIASNKLIKITALTTRELPVFNYEIVFMKRNPNELLQSMQALKIPAMYNSYREKVENYDKTLEQEFEYLHSRQDVCLHVIDYNALMDIDTRLSEMQKLTEHFNIDASVAIQCIDDNLYRHKG